MTSIDQENRGCRIAAALLMVFLLAGCGEREPVVFPQTLEDGKLAVISLFQYTGVNPDCGDEVGEDIAALAVTNQSDQYLSEAEITLKMDGGEQLVFQIMDVPAGQTVWVFERENTRYDAGSTCEQISCRASFEDKAPLLEELAITAEGTAVTLTNLSDNDLKNLTIYCHCLFDGTYFGGLTYAYPVPDIPAGESVLIQAEECYLGEAAAVQVSADS